MKQYKKSAIFAMACGAITVLLGLAAMLWRSKAVSSVTVSAVVILNTILHYESYINKLRIENIRQPNVLSMAVAETVLLVFLAVILRSMDWGAFTVLFATYLVFNGTSLMAIPSAFARNCGISAVALGAVLFLLGREFDPAAALLVGANLILNGAERIVMSALGGKKED